MSDEVTTPTGADAPGSETAVSEPAKSRASVRVPVWLLAVIVGAVLVVGAFFVGRSTAPDSGPTTLADAVEQTARGDLPVGQFDLAQLVAALQQGGRFNLGSLGNLLGNSN